MSKSHHEIYDKHNSNLAHDLSTVTDSTNTTVVDESECYIRQPTTITSTVRVTSIQVIPASEGQALSLQVFYMKDTIYLSD